MATVIESLCATRGRSPARACPIIRHVYGLKQLSVKSRSLLLLLVQIKAVHREDFTDSIFQSEDGTRSLRLADNIDLIAAGSQRQTDITYEPMMDLPTYRFCMEVRIEMNNDIVTTRKVTPCKPYRG